MCQIIIIGAGVAGIAAAEYLQQAGHTPCLVERASRAGGRCATATRAGLWLDYGAQYFTAREPAFQQLVNHDLNAGYLQCWTPAIAHAEQIANTWLLTPSPDPQQRLIGPGGLQGWVENRLRQANPSLTHRHVQQVKAKASGWQLDCENGDTLHADQLICAAPARQTAALLGTLGHSIPPLKQADQALLPCHACLVRAPATEYQAIFFDSDCLAWAADNHHKAGQTTAHPHVWTLHSTPAFSQAHAHSPPETIARMLVQEFARAMARPVAEMEILHLHAWHQARPGPGAPEAQDECWADPQTGLAIAGDWLAGGRIEGAWLSGRAAARQLLATP